MNILILNWKAPDDADAGGAERYVERLSGIWAASGHQVSLLVPRRGGRPPRERLNGVDVVRSGNRYTVFHAARRYLERCGSGYDRVLEAISTRPFFSHEVVGDRAVALYMQMADDVWDVEYPFPISWLGRRIIEPRWVRRMAGARVISISESTASDLRRYGVASIAIVPPGVDDAVSRPTPKEWAENRPQRILYIGRLVKQKRAEDALAAFQLIQARVPDAELDVIGDGYLRSRLERMHVPGARIHGFVSESEKGRLLDSADLMLIPATREGFGIIAIEAALHGIPVVAYDVNGLRDSVSNGVSGVLCSPSAQAMADSATRILNDDAARRSMSAAGREWALQFTWQRAAHAVMRVLAEPG
jgi:glycosyltransferase involved in cell wall biosynthesis